MTDTQRARSYRDFVPNRFRSIVLPEILSPRPGAVVITSRGSFDIADDGTHQRRTAR